jgi:hypothetical protein
MAAKLNSNSEIQNSGIIQNGGSLVKTLQEKKISKMMLKIQNERKNKIFYLNLQILFFQIFF